MFAGVIASQKNQPGKKKKEKFSGFTASNLHSDF